MAAQQKLTKKQRKGLAFRQKIGKRKMPGTKPEPEDVPETDILDDGEGEGHDGELAQVSEENLGMESPQNGLGTGSGPSDRSTNVKAEQKVKGQRHISSNVNPTDAGKPRIRKRPSPYAEAGADAELGTGEDIHAPSNPRKKKRKLSEPDENDRSEVFTGKQRSQSCSSKSEMHKSRYILFVGNLKYTTSKEAIQVHFSHCDPPPIVRLLTPKPSSKSSSATLRSKSKGCAFLEFSTNSSLQQALKLHHSSLDGRQINVELTAGGGGKSERRLQKVKSRNRQLELQRKKHIQKPSADTTSADADFDSTPSAAGYTNAAAQRHSSTSGSTPVPITTTARRTWSIPEPGDDNTARLSRSAGGADKKRGKKGKSKKDLGTGVNAIPVG